MEAHRVGQQTVFPGAGYIDVLMAVLQDQNQLLSEKVLRNVHFHRAMVIPDGEWLAMKTISDNSGKLSIYAGIASKIDEWSLHATAEFVGGKFTPPVNDPTKALTLIHFNPLMWNDFIKTKRSWAGVWTDFSNHQGFEEKWAQALLELETDDQSEHFINPALLDGAFQAMLALNESETAYLPVGIKEIRFYQNCHCMSSLIGDHPTYGTGYLR